MKNLKFAVIGTGFWANYQIPAWFEVGGVELLALYNRTRSKADVLAQQFKVPYVYDRVEDLLDRHSPELDFVDIITDVDTHAPLTALAASYGLDVICQKPMSTGLEAARNMLEDSRRANVRLLIHENFRWQAPIRKLQEIINSGAIGKPFKARLSFCSGFPVFANQPFLADLEQFILTDIGSHLLDVCRFLFGEVASLYCQTRRVNPRIKGEDVANVLMQMRSGLSCYAEMSYASILEKEAFPQTLAVVEGETGSVVLTHDFQLRISTRQGTVLAEGNPTLYSWLDPAYAVVHSSIVDCNRNLLAGLRGTGRAETTAEDNFETIRLVYAAYESAARNEVVYL
ncbi:Gfo/Idh/MocA family protein [Larkinella rosea]|uniref:Gfo/Idh/MocA family oxidoreductase n=1 Tax=Larkinella rosea TaxID=2025312 RepID=A0A3P1BTE5_9BACT|nr:Gfo/Idh/MocA family oxidoreductase [Larkinella rosea]RRB04292.1 gfo/Idh/MocA family oxidoreductase [Larkinella rosea]